MTSAAERANGSDGLRFVLAFQLLVLLAAVLPLTMRAGHPQSSENLGVWLSWSVCIVAAFRLALLTLDGSMRVLSLSFWVFVYVWLGAAPLAQFGHGYFPHRGTYTRSEILTAFAVIAVGLVCYEVGKRLPSAASAPLLLGAAARRVVSVRRVLLFGVIAIVGCSAIAYAFGGTELLFAPRSRAHEALRLAVGERTERLHIASRAMQVPPFVALYLATWLLVARAKELAPRRRLWLQVLCGTLLVMNLVISNPVNSPRYWVGTMALSLGLIVLPWSRRWSFTLWATLLTTAMLLVFPYADLFRQELDIGQFQFRGLEPVATKGDYDAFQQILNAVPFVEENGWSWGRQFAGTLLFWVPRAWWPGKPLPSGNLVAEFSSYNFTNLSMPLWGEAFLDGGLLAVALLFLLYGRLSESVERAYLRGSARGSLFHLMLPMIAGYQIFLLRGALMVAVAYLAPLLLGLVIVTRRDPLEAPARAELESPVVSSAASHGPAV